MRILLTCVGLNDPRNREGKEGPILSSMDYIARIERFRVYHPDRIYLLSTAEKPGASKPTQSKGNEVQQILKERGWEVYHRVLDLLDPTDYAELFREMRNAISKILQESGNQQAEIFVNVSPGTPQMQAVWMSLINAGALKARALQVKDPADEPDENKRLREVDIKPLFESEFIRIGHDLFSQYAFKRAAEVFYNLALQTPDYIRTEKAEFFSDLSNVYAEVENFEYKKAWDKLQNLLERYKNLLNTPEFEFLKHELGTREAEALQLLKEGDFLFDCP